MPRRGTAMRRLAAIIAAVGDDLFPPSSTVAAGPPVSRAVLVQDSVMAAAVLVSFLLGVPTVTAVVLPMFAVAIILLCHTRPAVVAAGYAVLTAACMSRAMVVWVVPFPAEGLRWTACVLWAYLAWRFTVMSRMVWCRGARGWRR